MAKIDSPAAFSKKISEALGTSEKWVDEWFEIEEDKQGYFAAKLKSKKFLDKAQFKTMCTLTRDLSGEAYLPGSSTWKVAGAYAKKGAPGEEGRIPPSQRISGLKTGREPTTPALPGILFAVLPIKALLAMPFQSRTDPEDPELADLAESIKAYGILQPVVVRQKPGGLYEIAMGHRRVKAAGKAGLTEITVIIKALSDEEATVCNLIENIHRKDLSDAEKSQVLAELARAKGWNAQQVADHLKMSERWVYKYLPSELKQPEPEQLASARRALSSESQDALQRTPAVKSVACARCGDPASEPVHLSGKFYCGDCAEQAVAEARPGSGPPLEPGSGSEQEEENEEEGDSEAQQEKADRPEPLLTGFEWTCPECGKKFIINHVDYPRSNMHDHVLEACG